MSLMKLSRHGFIVDILGVFLSIMTIVAFFFPDLIAWSDLRNFLQNFGANMMGAWAAVRSIDFLIQRREKFDAKRIKVLRHIRFWIHQLQPFCGDVNYRDLSRLQTEQKYTFHVSDNWKKYLEPSEREKFELVITQVDRCLSCAKDIEANRGALDAGTAVFKSTLPARLAISNQGSKFDSTEAVKLFDLNRSVDRLSDLTRSYIHNYGNVMKSVEADYERLENISAHFGFDAEAKAFVIAVKEHLFLKNFYDDSYNILKETVFDLEKDIREETIES